MPKDDKKISQQEIAGGITSGIGLATIKNQIDRGNLTGREKLYHNTHIDNVNSILENGFSGKKATDKKVAVTPEALSHLKKKNLKNKVYFGRNKQVADGVGLWAASEIANKNLGENASFKDRVKEHSKQRMSRKTLKASMPTWKLNEVDNPELLGAKSLDEYINNYNANVSKGKAKPKSSSHLTRDYRSLGRKGTAVIGGNVPSEYIKGHKGYNKLSVKEFGEYLHKNPERFKKSFKYTGAGVGAVGAGALLAATANKNKDVEKTAGVKEKVINAKNTLSGRNQSMARVDRLEKLMDSMDASYRVRKLNGRNDWASNVSKGLAQSNLDDMRGALDKSTKAVDNAVKSKNIARGGVAVGAGLSLAAAKAIRSASKNKKAQKIVTETVKNVPQASSSIKRGINKSQLVAGAGLTGVAGGALAHYNNKEKTANHYCDEIEKKANLLSKKDITHKNPNSNINIVTGFSGSGKTTLAEKLEHNNKNNIMVELDGFQHGYDSTNKGIVDAFVKRHGYNDGKNPNVDTKKIFEYLEDVASKDKDSNYIVDGVQMLGAPFDVLKNHSVHLKGTGLLKSSHRRHKRDKANENCKVKENLYDALRYNSKLDSKINNLRRNIKNEATIEKKAFDFSGTKDRLKYDASAIATTRMGLKKSVKEALNDGKLSEDEFNTLAGKLKSEYGSNAEYVLAKNLKDKNISFYMPGYEGDSKIKKTLYKATRKAKGVGHVDVSKPVIKSIPLEEVVLHETGHHLDKGLPNRLKESRKYDKISKLSTNPLLGVTPPTAIAGAVAGSVFGNKSRKLTETHEDAANEFVKKYYTDKFKGDAKKAKDVIDAGTLNKARKTYRKNRYIKNALGAGAGALSLGVGAIARQAIKNGGKL